MIEIRELVIRVNVTQDGGAPESAAVDERLVARLDALKAELLEACDARIDELLARQVER